MLSRSSLDRSTPTPSPLITPLSQNDVCSQNDSKVPATPRYLCHERSFDQNVPSTPFNNIGLPNRAPTLSRETDVSNVATDVLMNSNTLIDCSKTLINNNADQLVPSTPESCTQKEDAEKQDMSPVLSQDVMPVVPFQDMHKSSLNKLNKSELFLNKCKNSCRRAAIVKTIPKLNDFNSSFSSTLVSTSLEQSHSDISRSGVTFSQQSSCFQLGLSIQHGPASHHDLSSELAAPFQHSPSSTLPEILSQLQSTVINRSELTNTRRCSFAFQVLQSFINEEEVIEQLFSGDDIFL
ncbi:uncharacterized protein LOC106080035 isoform X2 [Biomphalaria glabrata]|nr:uncharacterized protein LOC106080035 isoform X2 [Biomphalaria glabrata]